MNNIFHRSTFYPPERLQELSEEHRQMLISTFHYVDERGVGFIRQEDLKVAVVYLCGYKPSKYELKEMISKSAGTDEIPSSGISLERFIHIMKPKMQALDEDDEIRQTFLALDSKCRGFISLDDLKLAFKEMAPNLPLFTIESAFREIDRDGDGRVSYKDFEFMMKYSKENGF